MKFKLTITNVEYNHEEVKIIEATDTFHELMRIRAELENIMKARYPYHALYTMMDINVYNPTSNVVLALIMTVSDGYSQYVLYKIKLEEDSTIPET